MRSLLILAALAALPAGAFGYERVIRQDFPVAAHCSLKIDTYRGAISVTTADTPVIRVEIHLLPGAKDRKEADRILTSFDYDLKQDGNQVTIVARNPKETRVRFLWEESQRINVGYYLLVPKSCAVDLKTADGGVTVGDLEASATVRAHKGVIYLKHIDGDIDAETQEADIVISRGGANAKIADKQGNIRSGSILGKLDVTDLNGDIDIQRALGEVKAYDNAGDISIGLGPKVGGDVKVDTNGGTITVRLDPKSVCTLHGSSGWGHVRTKIPIQVTLGGNGKSVLQGDFNGGGPVLTLHASGGHVEIVPPRI